MRTTTVIVVLEIKGSQSDAFHVVDSLLDAGFLQDAINDHDDDEAGELHVTSAWSTTSHQFVKQQRNNP